MTSTTLAARIATLTHHIDTLEVIHATFYVSSIAAEERRAALGFEIAGLHDLIDSLNADYAELEDATQDAAFENAGR